MRIQALLLLLLGVSMLSSRLVVSFVVVLQQQKPPSLAPTSRCRSSLLFSTTSTTTTTTQQQQQQLAQGLVKTVTKQGNGPTLNVGDIATLRYSCYHNGNVFSRSMGSQKMVVSDGTMIPAWERSIKTMRVGERSIIRVTDPELGYGSVGVPPVIPPNAEIELDIEVLDAQSATANIDFDSIALADKTPRTASEIAAAFEVKQAQKALQGPAKEGLEGFIEKAQKFYFFGLFEGETGERPPWFLRPSITFPLAFVIVGATFYITFAGGAIYERGAQIKDELDEFIVSYNNNYNDNSDITTGIVPHATSMALLALSLVLSSSGTSIDL